MDKNTISLELTEYEGGLLVGFIRNLADRSDPTEQRLIDIALRIDGHYAQINEFPKNMLS